MKKKNLAFVLFQSSHFELKWKIIIVVVSFKEIIKILNRLALSLSRSLYLSWELSYLIVRDAEKKNGRQGYKVNFYHADEVYID